MIPLLFLAEHLQKIPYLLSLFLPVAIFFTFGLWLARRKYQSDHKRLNRAVEENDHLAADITRALAPEKDVSKSLFGRLEMQRDHWAAEIKRAQDDLFTERCRTRDLRNQLDQQQGTSLPVPDPDKDRQIQALVDSNNSLEQEIKGLTSSREEILNQLETLRLAADRSTQQYQEHLSGLEAELETLRKENSSPVQTSLPLSDTPPSLQDLGYLFSEPPAEADDLKLIKGLGKVLETKLNNIGVYRFEQISQWDEAQQAAFAKKLSIPNRLKKDRWSEQAAALHQEHHGVT